MKIRTALYVTSLAALTASAAQAQETTVEKELLAARDTIWRAFFANDSVLLARFLPPAAATLEGGAHLRWSARPDIIAGAAQAERSQTRLVGLTFTNTEIVRTGHTALLHSNYQLVARVAGQTHTMSGRATELFVRVGTTWVNPYWQLEENAAGAEREVQLPDTLGANFAIGDSVTMKGALADYDALIGTWEFRFQVRKADGSYYPAFPGHWTFEKRAGGGLVEDRWRPDDASTPMDHSLFTSRTFDPARQLWQMIGSQSSGGRIQPGLTWSDRSNRYAIQRSEGAINRIRYLAMEPDRFLWRSDRSTDGGKTWMLDAAVMSARRISK